jgi:hypothetical protein
MSSYLVCGEGDEDVIEDATIVEAISIEEAAEKYVEQNFTKLSDGSREVDVYVKRESDPAEPIKFTVYAYETYWFKAKVAEPSA